MLVCLNDMAASFNAVHGYATLIKEGVEQTHGIGSAADTGDERIWKAAFFLQNLFPGLFGDHGLEIPHDGRPRNVRGLRSVLACTHEEDWTASDQYRKNECISRI